MIELSNATHQLTIHTETHSVTGITQKILQNKVIILNQSTMLSLREISELIGTQVNWDQTTNVIEIISSNNSADTSTVEKASTLSNEEKAYFTQAYAISNKMLNKTLELEKVYIDGYTFVDVVSGENQTLSEKYSALHIDLTVYTNLIVPTSLQKIYEEILNLKKAHTEVILDPILTSYSKSHELA